MIKNICIAFVCFLSMQMTFAQDDPNGGFDYKGELSRSIPNPMSPEAAAFMQYGDVAVNSYTGSLGYSLPLYTHSGIEMSLPISLSYNQDIKVSQIATGAGLGWNLNIGGRISRVVNGKSDNGSSAPSVFSSDVRNKLLDLYTQGTVFSSVNTAKEYSRWVESISKGRVEVHPDYFTVNVLGINEVIAFDLTDNMRAKVISNPRLQVAVVGGVPTSSQGDIAGWIITGEDGTRYHFGSPEYTKKIGDDASPGTYNLSEEYNSSWVLTKIESPNRFDTYKFEYEAQDESSELILGIEYAISSTTLKPMQTSYGIGDNITATTPNITVRQQFLQRITHNDHVVYDISFSDRYDYRQYNKILGRYSPVHNAIDKIDVYQYDYKESKNTLVKIVDLVHSYFGPTKYATSPESVEGWDHLKIRLKLDNVVFKTATGLVDKTFGYEYHNPTAMPSRNSKGRDYMGYNNGKSSNKVLFPKVTARTFTMQGANRSVNPSTTQVGVLNKVIYPTKGYTAFEYENHRISKTTSASPELIKRVEARGGISDFDCRGLCMDKYMQPPVVRSVMMRITKSGVYKIDFTNTAGSMSDTWIIKRPNTTIRYDDLTWGAGALPQSSFVWTPVGHLGSYDQNKYLAAGNYQITIANKQAGTRVGVEIIDERKGEYQIVQKTLPGLRLKTVTNYDHTDKQIGSKKYRYTMELGSVVSSAVQLYNPTLVNFNESTVFPGTGFRGVQTVTRKSVTSGSPQNHIVYRKVYEYNQSFSTSTGTTGPPDLGDVVIAPIDGTESDDTVVITAKNGYTETTFHAGPNGIIPDKLGNNYVAQYKNGQPKSIKVYDARHTLQSEKTFTYATYPVFASPGLAFQMNEDNKFLYEVYLRDSNNKIYIGNYPGNARCFGCPFNTPITSATPPIFCVSADAVSAPPNLAGCNQDNQAASRQLVGRSINGRGGYVSREVEKIYNVADTIVNTKDYNFDPALNYLLRDVTTTTSVGETNKTKYYYPIDYVKNTLPDVAMYSNDEKTAFLHLSLQNRNGIAIRTELYKDSQRLFAKSTSFKKYNDQGPFVHKAYYAKGDAPFHTPIEYLGYNGVGKPTWIRTNGHTNSMYVYGYGNRWLIAKIENPTIQDDNAVTNPSLNPDVLLQDLYEIHPNAMITGYSYNFLGQLTRMVDPKGYSMSYQYDPFNRLLQIKDAQGNIISKNEYNYKNN